MVKLIGVNKGRHDTLKYFSIVIKVSRKHRISSVNEVECPVACWCNPATGHIVWIPDQKVLKLEPRTSSFTELAYMGMFFRLNLLRAYSLRLKGDKFTVSRMTFFWEVSSNWNMTVLAVWNKSQLSVKLKITWLVKTSFINCTGWFCFRFKLIKYSWDWITALGLMEPFHYNGIYRRFSRRLSYRS